MSGNKSGSGRMEVPQAREAMDRFKMEVASEIGVPLKEGYNGDLTSAQNGSVGGEMCIWRLFLRFPVGYIPFSIVIILCAG